MEECADTWRPWKNNDAMQQLKQCNKCKNNAIPAWYLLRILRWLKGWVHVALPFIPLFVFVEPQWNKCYLIIFTSEWPQISWAFKWLLECTYISKLRMTPKNSSCYKQALYSNIQRNIKDEQINFYVKVASRLN